MDPSDMGIPPIALLQLLERGTLGVRATDAFRSVMFRERVDLATIISKEEQVPLRWFHSVYPTLDVDHATVLGFMLAEEAQLTTFGPLSLPLISASSVLEVVELLTYLPVISTAVSPQFYPGEHELTIGLSGQTNDHVLDCLAVSYCGCALLRLLDILAGDMPAVTLKLSWPAPSADPKHRLLQCERVEFDAPTSFVRIPRTSLDKVCRFSDAVAYRVGVDSLRQNLASRNGRSSMTERVTRLIEADPAKASTRAIAIELSISVSTLKRRLSDEGTSFRDLRQSVLQAVAIVRLLDRSLSVSRVATGLGYSDVSNFSHAFRRWTGQSPYEFRSGH